MNTQISQEWTSMLKLPSLKARNVISSRHMAVFRALLLALTLWCIAVTGCVGSSDDGRSFKKRPPFFEEHMQKQWEAGLKSGRGDGLSKQPESILAGLWKQGLKMNDGISRGQVDQKSPLLPEIIAMSSSIFKSKLSRKVSDARASNGSMGRKKQVSSSRRWLSDALNQSPDVRELQAPALNSGPTLADINMTWFRWDSVDAARSVDWRLSNLMTDVRDQFMCESCWALTSTDLVSIMWALVTNRASAIPLSAQQSCDCTIKKCCQGGWPEWVFQYIIMNGGVVPEEEYPYMAIDGWTCLATSRSSLVAQMTGWERVPSRSIEGMMKAVSQHPVLAFLSASSPDFQGYRAGVYDGTCSTDIDHAVLVVGYETDVAKGGPYWIIKNTWGYTWGEGGYMRLIMGPGKGKCGILSENAMYPTFYPNPDNAAQSSLITAGAFLPNSTMAPPITMNLTAACELSPSPCGAGNCYMENDAARCSCPPGYVERLEKPMPKCVSATPCSVNPNPCGFGSCNNEFDGSYSCICPQGSVIGSRADGGVTCVVGSFQSGVPTYTTIENDTCENAASAANTTVEFLQQKNLFLDCSEHLPAGMVLIAAETDLTLSCRAVDVVGPSDTCYGVAKRNQISVLTLRGLNPLLDCNSLLLSQRLCVSSGSVATTTMMSRSCGQSYDVQEGDTCSSVISKFSLSSTDFFWLNPGVICNTAPLPEYLTLCVAPLTSEMLSINCTSWYTVQQGDTCPRIWNSAGLTETSFLLMNPGIRCNWPYFQVGQLVCLDALRTQTSFGATTTLIPYNVMAGDTPQSIVSSFVLRCNISSDPTPFCDLNSLPDCTPQSIAIGQTVLVPCNRRVGTIYCGCRAESTPVCGDDFRTYASTCDAVCNYATVLYRGSCTGCKATQCLNRAGQRYPQWGCSAGWAGYCPYPTWPPPSTTDYWKSSSDCNFYNAACSLSCYYSAYTLLPKGSSDTQYANAIYSCYSYCSDSRRTGCP